MNWGKRFLPSSHSECGRFVFLIFELAANSELQYLKYIYVYVHRSATLQHKSAAALHCWCQIIIYHSIIVNIGSVQPEHDLIDYWKIIEYMQTKS